MSMIFLETERLVLREFSQADAENLFMLDSDPGVMRFLNGGKPTPRVVVETDVLPKILAESGKWAAVEKSSGAFIGWFELSPAGRRPGEAELGYRLRTSTWGKGYATEGSLALIRKGFTALGLDRIVAFTMTVNTGSRRVMEKCGLTFVRTFFDDWPEPVEGSELGDVEYALERADWDSTR